MAALKLSVSLHPLWKNPCCSYELVTSHQLQAGIVPKGGSCVLFLGSLHLEGEQLNTSHCLTSACATAFSSNEQVRTFCIFVFMYRALSQQLL